MNRNSTILFAIFFRIIYLYCFMPVSTRWAFEISAMSTFYTAWSGKFFVFSFDHSVCCYLSKPYVECCWRCSWINFRLHSKKLVDYVHFIKCSLLIFAFHSQIEYDSGFMYDVSQMESEFNGEIKSIVPAEHKKHRHKWVALSLFYTLWHFI